LSLSFFRVASRPILDWWNTRLLMLVVVHFLGLLLGTYFHWTAGFRPLLIRCLATLFFLTTKL
jgi:hypothetical protein